MGQQVHGHRGHGDVHFATCGALLGHLAVYAPVCLFVPTQVGGRGVGFAALTAGVPLGVSSRVPCSFPSWSSIHDEKGIHSVALAHSCVSVDVSAGWWRDLRPWAVRLVRITMDITVDASVGVVNSAIDDWWRAWGGYFRDDRWVTSHHIIIGIWTQIITGITWGK